MKGNIVEARHDPTVKACIMSEYHMDDYVRNKPPTLTVTLLKRPSGLLFEYRGIVNGVPILINGIEMFLDFHVYPTIDFGVLLGYPLEELLPTFDRSLVEEFRRTISTTIKPCLEIPMVEPYPKQNLFETTVHSSPFTSSDPALSNGVELAAPKYNDSEDGARSSSLSNEVEPPPSDPILYDDSPEIGNSWAIEFDEALALDFNKKASVDQHENLIFETPPEPSSYTFPQESAILCTMKEILEHKSFPNPCFQML
ncbi:hypothetical protein HU200_013781 [Digitaria exilis]|uniref:Uncharacterized protein n=1 Tax=Digitaria exilis TaxID=1010633 RepID=A0A835FD21_9POAL|nr:hypothetical protein HU200_013781 [Digitaria exilis]